MSSNGNNRQGSRSGVASWLVIRPAIIEILLPALTVMFGLQVLRLLVPGLTWILGDRLNLGAVYLGGIALLVFATAFMAGGLRRLLGGNRSIIVTAGGLGLLRLLMQVWWDEPLVNLILAMAGTVLFVIFLPIRLNKSISRSSSTAGYFAIGLLTGLALDTAVHAALLTYDSIWQTDWPIVLLTVVLVLLQWLLLWSDSASRSYEVDQTSGSVSFGNGVHGAVPPTGQDNTKVSYGSGKKTWAWLAIGPFLFLQLVVLHNVGRLAVLTGWSLHITAIWVLVAQLIGLVVVVWVLIRGVRFLWIYSLLYGLLLIVASSFTHPESNGEAFVALLAMQVSASLLIAFIIAGYAAGGGSGRSAIMVANGIGMLLLVVMLLGYYVVHQIKLPYDNTVLEIAAAVIIAVCGVLATVRARGSLTVSRKLWIVPALSVLLLLPSLAGAIAWHEPEVDTGDGFPVRVMTYNLHNGFNTDGYLGMEALAEVIEESEPDIVVLQEISRGWVISGRLDILTWLSQRLDMPYISGPTADPLWGNAILSRYPVVEYVNHELPPRDLFILRGFTAALVDIGGGEQLQVIATHFHHLDEDTEIRQEQSPVILDFWDGANTTVILGDLNADPDSAEMTMFREAGLVDAAASVSSSPASTYDSVSRYRRIDYIWVSPDLTVEAVFVPATTASDHLPVIADISR
ncbi:MAG TPA: endonuclease [Dehalococcoidia bacterium]|nr:endonuclease [Dehalococcoidia bacterium]